jgi:hypothetical protein
MRAQPFKPSQVAGNGSAWPFDVDTHEAASIDARQAAKSAVAGADGQTMYA